MREKASEVWVSTATYIPHALRHGRREAEFPSTSFGREATRGTSRRAPGRLVATSIMSFDFGQFGSAEPADPTSDFLQREKEAAGAILGNDSDLFGSGQPAGAPEHDFEQRAQDFPALDDENEFEDALSGAPEQPVVPAAKLESGPMLMRADSLAEFGEPPEPEPVPAPAPAPAPEPEAQFEASFPETADLDAGVVPAPLPQERAPEPAETMPLGDKKTPFTYDELDEESDALRAWRAKQQEEIARRDAQSERQRSEAASKAEQEIDQFYADYNAQKEKNIRKNKEAEARFHEQKQQELAEGTTWTRITKLLDLQNSQSKTIAKVSPGSSDLARMKELYLSLRREGESAPGAAGY